MKKFAYLAAAVSAVTLASAAHAAPAKPIAGQYICTFDAAVSPGQVRAQSQRAANGAGGQLTFTYQNTVRGFAVKMPAGASMRADVANLRAANASIASCEQDKLVTLSVMAPPPGKGPGGGGGGDGGDPTQTVDWGVQTVGSGAPVSGRKAYVIDSGIDLDHPDLNVVGPHFYAVGKNADDQNGHGTHVAGTIGAVDNAIGYKGVAPGAPVTSVRVLDRRGSGSISGVIAGVDWVAANASSGDVANMSLGGGVSPTLDAAVEAAAAGGVWMVLAAGNESMDASNTSPARADGPRVLTISAVDSSNKLASFSNYGSVIDYAEPGVGIGSTYKSGGYATLSGTSMAAPHAAGILMTQNSINNGGAINDTSGDGTAEQLGIR
ncbi:S8 family serine peptidase [Sphingomicrobium astaxanthinifaciens]|uniref:S8 family serine peptidase n=1 Tax=Sphingomicrobium astaxanthinifaciens TaxID=1227949 RepID=UPI001FCAA040|nr:S8 family serine peptidase [Sphingomicrobium astaxanthinifaciens]MCJ7420676.1 S8 family serine peptidase [Sphingomicrobium astaxanthinifaciens]